MGKLYYLIGKSATGKDTITERLLLDETLDLRGVVQYATRPIRDGELDGREYHFITLERADELEKEGRVIETRAYNTVYGIWKYMFVDDGQIDFDAADYMAVGTIEAFKALRSYYGAERVIPIYIYVETGERLERALRRERSHDNPKYTEMCRRFLADEADFSDENLKLAGLMNENGSVMNAFENDDLERCIQAVREFILSSGKQ